MGAITWDRKLLLGLAGGIVLLAAGAVVFLAGRPDLGAAIALGTVVAGGILVQVYWARWGLTPAALGRALRWLGLAALAVLAVLAAKKLDPRELRRVFAGANVPLLAGAAAASVLALAMQAGRWLAIVRPVEPRARVGDAFFTLVAGYAIGLVVPARASDLARAHLMARRSGASMATLMATTLVDHLLGSAALFGALGLLAAISPLPVWLRSAGTVALAGAGGGVLALWLMRPRPGEPPPALGVRGLLARLRRGLAAMGSPRALLSSFLFAAAGWAAEVLIAHLCLRAFGLTATAESTLLVVLATTLAAAASLSPANAGAFEIACIVALSGLGIPHEPALAFAIGYHAVHLVPVGVIGGAWLLAHGYKEGLVREIP